jgi:hypothetical protein
MTSTLIIKAEANISAVKKEFNTHFPFLKLEFFHHAHKPHAGSAKKDLIKTDVVLKSLVGTNGKSSQVIVNEDMQVATLEKLFQDKFNISAQVFRKSGNSWLETSVTDDWTLKQQNEAGEELSNLATEF